MGITEDKATFFIKAIKWYMKLNAPDKLKLVFHKRIKSTYPQQVTLIHD